MCRRLSVVACYLLLTKHRENLQDDVHYSKGLAGKNKSLTKKVDELENRVEQHVELASQRLDLTQVYFEHVVSKLDIPEAQVKRLGRALRESVRAGEDLVTQEMSGVFLRDTREVLGAKRNDSESMDQLGELFTRISASRYERAYQSYEQLVKEDITTVDLAPQLQRVAHQILGNRFRLNCPSPPIVVSATLGILDLVFTETLMNAREYSPSSSLVEVTVVAEATAIEVRIQNQLLPGVMVSDQWFAPGYRGQSSPQRYATGVGQGLPLVHRLLSLISAEVSIAEEGSLCNLKIRFRNSMPHD